MSGPPIWNLVRLDLQQLSSRPSGKAYLTHLPQERDEVLRSPPGILVHSLPVVVIRGRRAHVNHDFQ